MTRITVLLQPMYLRRLTGFMTDETAQHVMDAYRAGAFNVRHEIKSPKSSFKRDDLEAAAEEAFDLTNNPSRQDERELLYGRFASVSTGDIVEVEDPADPEHVEAFLCRSCGWTKIEKAAA